MDRINDLLQSLKQDGQDISQTSDGYHTFAELYEFRKVYNAALFNEWSNFDIPEMIDLPKSPKGMMNLATVGQKKQMMDWLGIHYEENIYYDGNHCPVQILRNCVHPKLGLHVIESANF